MPNRDSTPARSPLLDRSHHLRPRQEPRFYGELFGWTSEDAGPEYGGYIDFPKDGERVAGCMGNDRAGRARRLVGVPRLRRRRRRRSTAAANGGR